MLCGKGYQELMSKQYIKIQSRIKKIRSNLLHKQSEERQKFDKKANIILDKYKCDHGTTYEDPDPEYEYFIRIRCKICHSVLETKDKCV